MITNTTRLDGDSGAVTRTISVIRNGKTVTATEQCYPDDGVVVRTYCTTIAEPKIRVRISFR